MQTDDDDLLVYNVVIFYVKPSCVGPPYWLVPIGSQELDEEGLNKFKDRLREKGLDPDVLFLTRLEITVESRDPNYPVRIYPAAMYLSSRIAFLMRMVADANKLDPDDF